MSWSLSPEFMSGQKVNLMATSDSSSRRDTLVALASGGFGGSCLAVVGAPFDVVKVRQQLSPASALSVTKSILLAEGIAGLWRGVTPPLIASVPQFAIVFASFDLNRRLIQQMSGRPRSDLRDTAIAGALVAIPTTFLYTPSASSGLDPATCGDERTAAAT